MMATNFNDFQRGLDQSIEEDTAICSTSTVCLWMSVARNCKWGQHYWAQVLGLPIGASGCPLCKQDAGLVVPLAQSCRALLMFLWRYIWTMVSLCGSCLQNSSSSDRVDHPCYPEGYISSFTTASVYSSPCAKQSMPPPASKNFTLVGTGNATLCRETFKSIFNFSKNCKYNDSCGFNGVYQPKVNGKFLVWEHANSC